jgi:heptosyltransferase-2
MVMAQSLFKILRRHTPGTRIEVLAPGWSLPLLQRMPEVDGIHEMPLGHGSLSLGVRWRLGRSLREMGFSRAILLPNSLKSALVPWFAGIPRRTGWVGEMRYGLLNDIRRLDKERWRLMVERFNALAYPADRREPPETPCPELLVDPLDLRKARQALGLRDEGPILALCPGAEFGPAKRWPARHYAALARWYLERGWSVRLFGSAGDRAMCTEINRLAGRRCVDLSGRTSLQQVVDLLSESTRVVSNDSGLMHVAAALGCQLVAVYGSTDPGFTPPLGPQSRIARLGIDCSPCFARECPLGHRRCLEDLAPDRVVQMLDGFDA